MSKYASPSLMGGEGSGVSQPFVDPKGQDVTLNGTSTTSTSKETENLSMKNPKIEAENHEATTPSLINCKNISFKYIPGNDDEEEEESEGEGK